MKIFLIGCLVLLPLSTSSATTQEALFWKREYEKLKNNSNNQESDIAIRQANLMLGFCKAVKELDQLFMEEWLIEELSINPYLLTDMDLSLCFSEFVRKFFLPSDLKIEFGEWFYFFILNGKKVELRKWKKELLTAPNIPENTLLETLSSNQKNFLEDISVISQLSPLTADLVGQYIEGEPIELRGNDLQVLLSYEKELDYLSLTQLQYRIIEYSIEVLSVYHSAELIIQLQRRLNFLKMLPNSSAYFSRNQIEVYQQKIEEALLSKFHLNSLGGRIFCKWNLFKKLARFSQCGGNNPNFCCIDFKNRCTQQLCCTCCEGRQSHHRLGCCSGSGWTGCFPSCLPLFAIDGKVPEDWHLDCDEDSSCFSCIYRAVSAVPLIPCLAFIPFASCLYGNKEMYEERMPALQNTDEIEKLLNAIAIIEVVIKDEKIKKSLRAIAVVHCLFYYIKGVEKFEFTPFENFNNFVKQQKRLSEYIKKYKDLIDYDSERVSYSAEPYNSLMALLNDLKRNIF